MRRHLGPTIGLLLAALMLHATPASASTEALVGGGEREDRRRGPLPQWSRVMAALVAEERVYGACERSDGACAAPGLRAWSRLLGGLRGVARARQLRAVNSFVNRQPYRTDAELWEKRDYWATPLEFLRHSGDCEDYAITKYVSLRRLGVPADDLRLLVVRDSWRAVDHAVLAARDDGTWYVLDNLSPVVVPQDEAVTYAPYYAINETTRWSYATTPAAAIRTGAR